MSDIAGFYSGRLEMPLIVDTEELTKAEDFENSINGIIYLVA